MEPSTFYLKEGNIFALPISHYTMEMAAQVRQLFTELQPDCVAVELAETMELQLLHAASRLPDISVVVSQTGHDSPLYYLCEPCDASFEGLRSALDAGVAAHCIDLDVDDYPEKRQQLPDAYAIQRIGLEAYYSAYKHQTLDRRTSIHPLDARRELHMARRLKELSLRHERVLFISGMDHTQRVLDLSRQAHFPDTAHVERDSVQLCTLSEESCREVLAECAWISTQYEEAREASPAVNQDSSTPTFPPDRQRLLLQLYKAAGRAYETNTGDTFKGYHLRNSLKFGRNYALIHQGLMPDLYQVLSSAKACVNHNYAYETWKLATDYPHLRNIDNLPVLNLSVEEVWGHSKVIRFHMKQQSRKAKSYQNRLRKDRIKGSFKPPHPFAICSYPPEDLVIENFGEFLKKKGSQLLSEEGARSVPFSTSLEDGVDTRETIRHWAERTLYVKVNGRPQGAVGSVVVIFDADEEDEAAANQEESYPWRTTWLGEHAQESDMSFYASSQWGNIVGPGISRCEYGGFMMSYPPRRLYDVWSDPDYSDCRNKPEVLLMAAIDYAVSPLIVYVAASPPRTWFKSYARRYGKKLVYVPIGQLSPITLQKIRIFHVLDGHGRRDGASEYIF
jgi:hypothetical protein